MDDKDITLGSQPDGSQLKPADAPGTVSNVVPPLAPQATDGMTLVEINQLTGKTFPSKEAALKSIRDTYSYVGKKKEDVRAEVLAEQSLTNDIKPLTKELEEMRKERFYDKNPQYATPELRDYIDAKGGKPEDVVNSENFKKLIVKVSSYDESQKLRTVLESNPRIASSKNSLQKARDMQQETFKTGSYSGPGKEATEQFAVNAVKDAFGL